MTGNDELGRAISARPLHLPQLNIGRGSAWFVPRPANVPVWGQVLTVAEMYEVALGHGHGHAEAEAIIAEDEAMYVQGWRTSRFYVHGSRMGYGKLHVSQLWPTGASQFQAADRVNFNHSALRLHPWYRDLYNEAAEYLWRPPVLTALTDPDNVQLTVVDESE